jgi:hypothetical protein
MRQRATAQSTITNRGRPPVASLLPALTVVRDVDQTVADLRLVAFDLPRQQIVNQLTGTVAVKQSGALMEFAIYDSTFARVVSSEAREVPEVGEFTCALPETTLRAGRYYLGLTTNGATAQFGMSSTTAALSCTAAFPAPATAAAPTATTGAPAVALAGVAPPATQGLFALTTSTVRCYGADEATSQPYGWNTLTGRIAKSVDSGASWQDLMPLPSTGQGNIVDMLVTGGKLYVFVSTCELYVSSDLTATATWTNISCPTTTGLRHATALGRPYGMVLFNGYLFIGEYSQAGGEFAPEGPRILRYKLADGTWALSKEFPASRHIHSFYTPGSSLMFVSIGDAAFGVDVGLTRLTPANIGLGTGGTDTYSRWTSTVAPYTPHYPVDIIYAGPFTYAGKTAPLGVYGASDRVGKHLLYAKTAGSAGSFNQNALAFQGPNRPNSETVRSIVFDARGNLYYWTAETTQQALFVCAPPYTRPVKLFDFPPSPQLFMTRAIRSGEYVLMFNQRFRTEKFVGQA